MIGTTKNLEHHIVITAFHSDGVGRDTGTENDGVHYRASGIGSLHNIIGTIARIIGISVVSRPSYQGVIPCSTDQGIIARSAFQPVLADNAIEHIITATAKELVITRTSRQVIVSGIAAQNHIACRIQQSLCRHEGSNIGHAVVIKHQVFNPVVSCRFEPISHRNLVLGVREVDDQVIVDPGKAHIRRSYPCTQADTVGIAPGVEISNGILAVTRIKHIGIITQTTIQLVITQTAPDHIITGIGEKIVCLATARHDIGAVRPRQGQ